MNINLLLEKILNIVKEIDSVYWINHSDNTIIANHDRLPFLRDSIKEFNNELNKCGIQGKSATKCMYEFWEYFVRNADYTIGWNHRFIAHKMASFITRLINEAFDYNFIIFSRVYSLLLLMHRTNMSLDHCMTALLEEYDKCTYKYFNTHFNFIIDYDLSNFRILLMREFISSHLNCLFILYQKSFDSYLSMNRTLLRYNMYRGYSNSLQTNDHSLTSCPMSFIHIQEILDNRIILKDKSFLSILNRYRTKCMSDFSQSSFVIQPDWNNLIIDSLDNLIESTLNNKFSQYTDEYVTTFKLFNVSEARNINNSEPFSEIFENKEFNDTIMIPQINNRKTSGNIYPTNNSEIHSLAKSSTEISHQEFLDHNLINVILNESDSVSVILESIFSNSTATNPEKFISMDSCLLISKPSIEYNSTLYDLSVCIIQKEIWSFKDFARIALTMNIEPNEAIKHLNMITLSNDDDPLLNCKEFIHVNIPLLEKYLKCQHK